MDIDQQQALRVLDANANRAAEGLRTLEDTARLVREDARASGELKQLRHQLAQTLALIPRVSRLQTRSTASDAGTELYTESELLRHDLNSIVPAACERVTQALRNLEEFSKLISAEASAQFKQLRYRAYDTLAQTELRWLGEETMQPTQQLYLLVDCQPSIDQFRKQLAALADAGVDLFQLRDKSAEGAKLYAYARAAVEILQPTQARLIVNDRIDIALASHAAGVHVGQDDLPLAETRRLTQGRLWIGVSTHDMDQALAAEQNGADYIGCGPTFRSTTKSFDDFAGPDFLQQVAEQISIPAFAIGGISLDNLSQVLEAGFTRIAVSGAIGHAPNPAQAAQMLKQQLHNSLPQPQGK